MTTTQKRPTRSHRARPDRRRPALLLAVAALAAAAGAALASGGGEEPAAAPASAVAPATVTVTAEVTVARTAEEIADDAFVLRAVERGWTTWLTASGSVSEARALAAALEADPDPATLTALLADLEDRTGIPPLDAWAFADDAVRTYARDLVQLLP